MSQTDLFDKKFTVLRELSSAIAFSDNIKTIADLLLDLAISYAHAEKASLMLLTERNDLSIHAAKGLDPKFLKDYSVKIGEGITGIVAQSRSPLLVKNIEKDPRFSNIRRNHYKTRSFISCPIISKNNLLGILNINDKRDGTPFNEDEFELIKTLANHAAIALENAFLLTQLKTKAAELEDINKKLAETDILKTEFLIRLSHELRTPLNSVKGAIYFLQQADTIEKKERQEFQGIISTEIDNLIGIVENLLSFLRHGEELRTAKKTIIHIGDIFRELQDSKMLKALLARKGIHLSIVSPDSQLEIVGDKVKFLQFFTSVIDGISHYLERGDSLHIEAKEDGHVNIDISVSRPFPESVMPILYDTRYLFQIEHPENQLKLYLAKNIADTFHWKLTAQNSDAGGRITLDIPKSTKETFDTYVGRSMDFFVEFISELLNLDICSIMLSDDLTSELTVKSAVGLDDEIVKKTRIKFGDKIAGWVALEGKPLFIENIEKDSRFPQKSSSQYTTKSLMSLPLKIGERVVGVLNLNNKKTSEPFTDRDYSIASLLSEKISQFVELLYSDNYCDDKMKQFIESLDSIFAAEKTYQSKKELLPELTNKIFNNSRLSMNNTGNRTPSS